MFCQDLVDSQNPADRRPLGPRDPRIPRDQRPSAAASPASLLMPHTWLLSLWGPQPQIFNGILSIPGSLAFGALNLKPGEHHLRLSKLKLEVTVAGGRKVMEGQGLGGQRGLGVRHGKRKWGVPECDRNCLVVGAKLRNACLLSELQVVWKGRAHNHMDRKNLSNFLTNTSRGPTATCTYLRAQAVITAALAANLGSDPANIAAFYN
ncbi:hypothetical protein BDK51DRAFT_46328 [Blyttiomyces helicus]|uniref:Uncharacterized protein n=1 Tax=Blyttiomyces helicus TaxID=388810 RepID=A0A4P9W291_9FUNG|nr:hypothetical protein BDK51DRAFT_46328 [Blyttiomyces helicus]|eukprot:RKO86349.1 hypothetical protein BDK51DRAFT_46328 [Blyttiomyces helicus]